MSVCPNFFTWVGNPGKEIRVNTHCGIEHKHSGGGLGATTNGLIQEDQPNEYFQYDYYCNHFLTC